MNIPEFQLPKFQSQQEKIIYYEKLFGPVISFSCIFCGEPLATFITQIEDVLDSHAQPASGNPCSFLTMIKLNILPTPEYRKSHGQAFMQTRK